MTSLRYAIYASQLEPFRTSTFLFFFLPNKTEYFTVIQIVMDASIANSTFIISSTIWSIVTSLILVVLYIHSRLENCGVATYHKEHSINVSGFDPRIHTPFK